MTERRSRNEQKLKINNRSKRIELINFLDPCTIHSIPFMHLRIWCIYGFCIDNLKIKNILYISNICYRMQKKKTVDIVYNPLISFANCSVCSLYVAYSNGNKRFANGYSKRFETTWSRCYIALNKKRKEINLKVFSFLARAR